VTGGAEGADAWRGIAGGWERRRALFWEATRPLSERMVALLDPKPGETILELAAGPGDTGFLAAERLGGGGLLLSTDVAEEMVDVARRRAAELGLANVSFRVVDASAIDLPDASVDGVLCRFGLMLLEDMGVGFSEVLRVLRPGGGAAIAVWAEPERNEWMTAAGRAAVRLGAMEPADPDSPGPFRLADPARFEAVITQAGLRVEALEEVAVSWVARSLEEWWETIRDTSPRLSALLADVDPDVADAVRAGGAELLAPYVSGDGSVTVPGAALVALARRPR
jgi:ubiquinone/menaquinone biosynthesis C-methylase UbiE